MTEVRSRWADAIASQRFTTFRFVSRSLADDGRVALRYALDDDIEFVESFVLPVPARARRTSPSVEALLSLLHWVAGVSYFKTAAPPTISCETGQPPPATAALLEALYSEGLAEYAYVNHIPIPRPAFPKAPQSTVSHTNDTNNRPRRMLVPVGGGKDSVVALEIVRQTGQAFSLFAIGDAPVFRRTAAVAGVTILTARRLIDPRLLELNGAGALNGHVPVTAIVSAAALLTAALNGYDTVVMANERSASTGSGILWDGMDVNHQFSKSWRAECLFRSALRESDVGLRLFSILRPASELAIARAFSHLDQYHGVFTSCNAVFKVRATARRATWCCECPKCRFVFLILAPYCSPPHLAKVFGCDLLSDTAQYAGFAALAGVGGSKPFECVGEVQESVAAMRLLADDARWRDHPVMRRLVAEVLPEHTSPDNEPSRVLECSDDHAVPPALLPRVRAFFRS